VKGRKGPPDARRTAYELLLEWESGSARADELLARVDMSDLRERRLLQELFYGVIRRRRSLDHVLDAFCRKGIDSVPMEVRTILRLGAYQILHSDRIPAYASVDQSVRLAKSAGRARMASLVNAVLRRVADPDQRPAPPDPEKDPIAHLGVLHSFPDWLVQRFVDRFGPENTGKLLEKANEPPPIHIRVNRRKATTREAVKLLADEGVLAFEDPVLEYCLRIEPQGPIAPLGCFREGYFQVQDRSAQLAAPVLDPKPKEVILDACAAPGGKATHIAELTGDLGTVIALDRTPANLARIEENVRRLGLASVTIHEADAAGDLSFFPDDIDRILVDAPCSGLGTLGRRADLRWRLQPDVFPRLAEQQTRILDNVSKKLARNGIIVYSTCTLAPEENRDVIRRFLGEHPEFRLESAAPFLPPAIRHIVDDEGFAETLPFRDEMDGSFLARLAKTGEEAPKP